MTEAIARIERHANIAVLLINAPPVNALGQAVRAELQATVELLHKDAGLDALVIACEGRTFFAGADIREFDRPPQAPLLPGLINAIEASSKPVIAAIHGTALGGGLEVALGCHLRIAAQSAKMGLPEVKLGLLPGAGGTQRLPRLVGLKKALDMMVSGEPIGAAEAQELGLVDRVVEDQGLIDAAIALARDAVAGRISPRKTRDRALQAPEAGFFAAYRKDNARKFGRLDAPQAIVKVVERSLSASFDDATAFERAQFDILRSSAQSKALRYAFFAERDVKNVPGIDVKTPVVPVENIGIIGAGTMGTGIAVNFLLAGLPVTLLEMNEAALTRGAETIRKIIQRNVESGRTSRTSADQALGLLHPTLAFNDLASADLVIEAAFETLDVKQDIFTRLDAIAKPGAILATNTSYLDVDKIASFTARPEHVLGLHFFSPANVMKLLEVVRGAKTSGPVLATALKLAARIGKIPVVSGVCYGFIGNRMLAARRVALDKSVLEGASPYAIDRVAEEFGFAMGPFRVSDLAGLDLGWSKETSTGATMKERLCEMDRRGQKTKAGYYDYDDKMKPSASPLVEQTIKDLAAARGIPQRAWIDAELLDLLLTPMIAEGRKILAEGIALRASDIDVVWLHGYGWPRWRGGPMYYGEKHPV
ncbi:MAG: enoyl-CoA hydratase/isomerase family protein [Rhodospirillaceae bacterium]|nr:enoyl-CoA hydratase/isomerase family protein [Rhodospirillaceae bacterium]